MSLRRAALDANLLVLFVVGRVHPGLIATHKRLKAFDAEDHALLLAHLDDATLMTTPNAMTEASNLVAQGVREPARSALFGGLKVFSETTYEAYVPSIKATSMPEFLGAGWSPSISTISETRKGERPGRTGRAIRCRAARQNRQPCGRSRARRLQTD